MRFLCGLLALIAATLAALFVGTGAREMSHQEALDRRGEPDGGQPEDLVEPIGRMGLDGVARSAGVFAGRDLGRSVLIVNITWRESQLAVPGIGFRVVAFGGIASEHQTGTSDSDGRVVFDVPVGDVTVYCDRGPRRSLTLQGDNVELDYMLDEHSVIYGMVVDGDGNGAAAAEIWVTPRNMWSGAFHVATSSMSGRFTVRGLGGHDGRHLWARHWSGGSSQPVALPEGEGRSPEEPLTLVCRGSTATVRGTVAFANGRPAPETRISVGLPRKTSSTRLVAGRAVEEVAAPPVEILPSRDGSYQVEVDSGTPTSLSFRNPGCPTVERQVTLGAGEVEVIDVQLQQGVTISGAVYQADGTPAEGAVVGFWFKGKIRPPLDFADRDGRYLLSGLEPEKEVVIKAHSSLFGEATTRVKPTNERHDYNLFLDRGLVLRGVVLTSSEGEVDDWIVAATNKSSGWTGRGAIREGRFELVHCPDSRLSLALIPKGLASALPITFDEIDDVRSEVLLDLRDRLPLASISGWVIANPALGRVSVTAYNRSLRQALVADVHPSSGRFEIGGLPAGSYDVSAFIEKTTPLQLGTYQVAAGQHVATGTYNFQLPGGVTVRVESAAETVRVDVLNSTGSLCDSRVFGDGSGEARLKLPGGQYVVLANAPGYAPESRRVRIDSAEAGTVTFQLKNAAPRVRLAGVTDVSGILNVTVSNGAGPLAHRIVEVVEGMFRVHLSLPAGTYVLTAHGDREYALQVVDGQVEYHL